MENCPKCDRPLRVVVVVRTDDYQQTYRYYDDGRGYVLVGDVQTDTQSYEQYCGHCRAFLRNYGEVGEIEDEGPEGITIIDPYDPTALHEEHDDDEDEEAEDNEG